MAFPVGSPLYTGAFNTANTALISNPAPYQSGHNEADFLPSARPPLADRDLPCLRLRQTLRLLRDPYWVSNRILS